MPYWRLFYHLVWATKDRAPLIDEAVAAALEQSMRATCQDLNLRLFALGLMPDHIHLVVSVPPSVALADAVRRLKGASSFAANGPAVGTRPTRFSWQGEYGVLSLGEKALPNVVAYACSQPAHHAADNLWPGLERISDPSQPL